MSANVLRALTPEELVELQENWPKVIGCIYPDMSKIPMGSNRDGSITIRGLLRKWPATGPYPRPSTQQLKNAAAAGCARDARSAGTAEQ